VNTWKVILATMVIFGTGVITGGLLVGHEGHIRHGHPPRAANANRQAQQPPSPGGLRLDLLRRLQSELSLTPDQKERIDAIIRQGQERTRKIMEPVRPQLQEEFRKTKAAFRDALTPEQQTRFDELLKQEQRPRESRRPQPARQHPEENSPNRTNSPAP
jgi:Spy/CpxP family protein refolding chaperone